MSSSYAGNPTAVQAPGPQPGPRVAPVVSDPADGDPLSAAAVIQAFKEAADFGAYLTGAMCHGNDLWEFYERWDIAPATITAATTGIADLAKRWSWLITDVAGVNQVDATQTVAWQDPSVGGGLYYARSAMLTQATVAAARVGTLVVQNPLSQIFTKQQLLVEFDIIPVARPKNIWCFGVANGKGFGTPSTMLMGFYNDQTLASPTNWYYGNAGNWVDSGVNIITGFIYKFRISLDMTLGTPSVKYYITTINTTGGVITKGAETLVGTVTTNMPAAGAWVNPKFWGTSDSVSGPNQYLVGEVRALGNRM